MAKPSERALIFPYILIFFFNLFPVGFPRLLLLVRFHMLCDIAI